MHIKCDYLQGPSSADWCLLEEMRTVLLLEVVCYSKIRL